MRSWIAATLAALMFAVPVSAQAQKPEQTKVRLAVGGKSSLYYLPLTIT
ncbi:MAG: ABC transporter substrate-binding protein, partial [Bradyrhizobium sp.]|nr:ABC transporter substrate-binding protein [Bradyrhizobium sp.]